MSGHTPGPWTVKLQAGTRWIEAEASNAKYPNEPIARVEPFNLQDEHNARLIALAPEMAQALRDAHYSLCGCMLSPGLKLCAVPTLGALLARLHPQNEAQK